MREHTESQERKNRSETRRRIGVIPGLLMMTVLFAGCMQYMTVYPSEYPVMELLTVSSVSAAAPQEDRVAPQIMGVRDLTVYEGDTVSYLCDVTAVDDRDPSPIVTADTSAVDLSTPGEYEVVYIATDAAGNKSRAAAMITVLEKECLFGKS